MRHLKVDYYLFLISSLIVIVFKASSYAFLLIFPVLFISYYRLIANKDITIVLILMLSARLIMGPFIINSDLSFNGLNFICNYLPIAMILALRLNNLQTVNLKKILSLKWTILYMVFILLFSLLHVPFAISVFSTEILPLILFLLVVLSKGEKEIDFNYLLKFFRYSFIACLIIYLSPDFYDQMYSLFKNGIIFKEATSTIALTVSSSIPRNTGFVFDFRIMGQLACLYLILLYYLGKKNSYWDVALLCIVAVLTFSRGPLMILFLLLIAVYVPKNIKITKRVLFVSATVFLLLIIGIIYSVNDKNIRKYVSTFNPLAEKNAFSQRGAFINYSLNKFYLNPLGSGIGSLSSPEADVKVFAGYTNLHKEVPDKVYYFKVGDAYLALSLAEKGLIGFFLMLFSFSELFYSNKNRISLFFLIGFYINIIGTDIPKQGFYYFVIILIYYGLSLKNVQIKPNET